MSSFAERNPIRYVKIGDKQYSREGHTGSAKYFVYAKQRGRMVYAWRELLDCFRFRSIISKIDLAIEQSDAKKTCAALAKVKE